MDGTLENIQQLQKELTKRNCELYGFNLRRAGWGACIWEKNREEKGSLPADHPDKFQDGLVVYDYYKSFTQMLQQEIERILEMDECSI
jgi:hypothetical protein